MIRSIFVFIVLFVLVVTTSATAAPPDAGTILREHKEPPYGSLPEKAPLSEPKRAPAIEDKDGLKIKVTGFDFEGATLFSAEELRGELRDFIGKELSIAQLEVAAQRISSYYRAHGRMATSYLPRQEVKEGRILIRIIEGKLGEIKIDPTSKSRMNSNRAMSYLLRENRPGDNVNMETLEVAIRMLKGLPGVVATTTILPGAERGTSDVMLQLADSPFLSGAVEGDNYGSLSSGEYRGAVSLNVNNPGGYGDQASLRLQSSVKNKYGRLTYLAPVGVVGVVNTLSSSYLHYDLGGDLQSRGDAATVSDSISIPLRSSRSFKLSGRAGYEFRWLYNEARTIAVSNKQLHTISGSISAEVTDQYRGGGYNNLTVGFGGGKLNLAAVSSDYELDQSGSKRNGYFGKITYSASRTQAITPNSTSLSLSLYGQNAFKNLDSSEQFGLGGAYGVRSYASGEANGDSGFVFSAELRQVLVSTVQASLFYDFGWIRLHEKPWKGWDFGSSTPNEYSLDGIGMGVTWTPVAWLVLKGTVATRIKDNSGADLHGNDSDGTKREPRFWVQTLAFF